jgi:hypothetical protein
MLSIQYLFDSKITKHLKKHWGKYALVGGGITASALGGELSSAGIRRAVKAGDVDDMRSLKLIKSGQIAQKYGNVAAGAGLALGLKGQLDNEHKLEKLAKERRMRKNSR